MHELKQILAGILGNNESFRPSMDSATVDLSSSVTLRSAQIHLLTETRVYTAVRQGICGKIKQVAMLRWQCV